MIPYTHYELSVDWKGWIDQMSLATRLRTEHGNNVLDKQENGVASMFYFCGIEDYSLYFGPYSSRTKKDKPNPNNNGGKPNNNGGSNTDPDNSEETKPEQGADEPQERETVNITFIGPKDGWIAGHKVGGMGAGETKTIEYGIGVWWTIYRPVLLETSKVSVVMGGVDITDEVYKYGPEGSQHVIINSVTDDVVFTYEQ